MTGLYSVRTISSDEHLEFINRQSSVSFLQTPAWALVKAEWRGESIGWFQGETLVGAGLVLFRKVPKLNRYLAYLPEGPAIDQATDPNYRLPPMIQHVQQSGAFGIRMGPPVIAHTWDAATIKSAIANPDVTLLSDVTPTETNEQAQSVVAHLQKSSWQKLGATNGFAAGQPAFNYQVPLAGRTEADVLAGMNQLWRRNIKKAAKLGVEVTTGTRADLVDFHRVYLETAERDGFTGRPLSYFEQMWDALINEDADRIRVYLAHHEGDLVASTIWIRVGEHAWYSYGASTTHKRDVRGSNAIQWNMIRDSIAADASVYDLRGITETVDTNDPHVGLIQFKVGTGGEAVEYLGEWDYVINRPLYAAFSACLKRRSAKG